MEKVKRLGLIAFIMIIFISSKFTIAYLTTTSETKNEFVVGTVEPKILETFNKSAKTKEDIKVKNNGNADIYVRAYIMYNFEDEDNNILESIPVLNTDYSVSLTSSNWIYNQNDGYYYYKNALSPNETTENLIDEIKILYSGDDKYVVVTVLAEAVQKVPNTAISDLWNKEISNDTIHIES